VKLSKFLETWEGALAENRFSRIVIVLLLVALILVSIKAFSQQAVVTIQPYTLKGEAWITENNASQSYKESWAMMLSALTGNVTPGTVDFVKQRIEPLLSPEIYQNVIDAIEVQALHIQNDRVSMRFEPRSVEYEPATDKVFVYGYSHLQGATGDPTREDRTYEYIIEMQEYAPMVTHIDTYSGRPRTERIRKQIERNEQRREEKANG
jgi:conjugal transfer pilus assembly protein TraE